MNQVTNVVYGLKTSVFSQPRQLRILHRFCKRTEILKRRVAILSLLASKGAEKRRCFGQVVFNKTLCIFQL